MVSTLQCFSFAPERHFLYSSQTRQMSSGNISSKSGTLVQQSACNIDVPSRFEDICNTWYITEFVLYTDIHMSQAMRR